MFKRPKADYQPQENLPNVDAFRKLAKEKKPNTASLLDALANYIVDTLNALKKQLDQAVVNLLPGADNPDNINKSVISNGVTWVFQKLTGINMEAGCITEREIKNGSVTQEKLDLQVVGTEQLEDGGVTTPKINDGAVTTPKIGDGVVTLPKMRSSGKKCLVMGTDGSNAYTEKVADNNAQPWYVFCNNPNAASIALNSLVDIWQNTPYTFTGAKLTDATVTLPKITVGVNTAGVVGSANATLAASFIGANAQTGVLSGTSAGISFTPIAQVINNDPNATNAINGNNLQNNTMTLAKLAQDVLTAIRDNDFATATVSINGTLLRKKNVASVSYLGTGLYRVNFASQPPSGLTTYNVQVSIGGEYSCSWANKTLNSVEVHIYTTSQYYDAPFDIRVSDAGT